MMAPRGQQRCCSLPDKFWKQYIVPIDSGVLRFGSSVSSEGEVLVIGSMSNSTDANFSNKRTSAGDLNLWSQPMMPYNAAHDFYEALDGTTGSLRDITSSISVRGIDSRFAMFSIDDSTTLESFNYIRIHIKRNR